MNKFLTKIGVAFVGIAMAIGVGIAVGGKGEAKVAEAATIGTHLMPVTSLTSGSQYVVVGYDTSSHEGALALPTSPTITSGKASGTAIASVPSDAVGFKWTFTQKSGNYWLIGDGSKYIYHSNGGSSGTNIAYGTSQDSYPWKLTYSAADGSTPAHWTFKGSSYSGGNYTDGSRGMLANSSQFGGYALSNEGGASYNYMMIYEVVSIANHTITYNGNGNTGGVVPSNQVGYGTVTLSSTLLTKSDYVHDGWGDSSHKNNETAQYPLGYASFDLSEDITLYAHWTPTYTVTYVTNSNGTGSNHAVNNVPKGTYELLTLAETGLSAKSGYAFREWLISDTPYAEGAEVSIGAATTVTANFVAEVTLSYDGNGSTSGSAPSNQVIPTGSSTTVAANPFSKTGYVFKEWNTAVDGSGDPYAPGDEIELTGNVTLHAIWQREGETITFTASTDGASGTSHTKSGITVSASDGAFSSNDYRFYKNQTATISSSVGKIAKIVFNCTAGKPASGFASISGWSTSGDNGTWVGSATSVTLTASIEQVRATSIVVTLEYVPTISITGTTTVKAGSTTTLAAKDPDTEETLAGVTWTSSNDSVATVNSSGVVTGVAKGSATITASKTGYNNQTASITVDYADVTNVEITTSASRLGKLSEFTFGATVSPVKANPNVKWSVEKKSGDLDIGDVDIDEDTGELTVAADAAGVLTITATTVGLNSSSEALTDSVDVEITDDPVVAVVSALAGYTGKNTSLAFTYSNFAGVLSVVSSDTSKVTVQDLSASTGSGTIQVNFVAAGSSTLTFKDGSTDVTTCVVTVTASAVSAVSWMNASDMTLYSGSTELNTSKITSWAPAYEMNNGDEDFVTSDYTVQLNGTPYTLGTALEAGTYEVSLTYGGQTTSDNPTVTVVQSLNTINGVDTYTWVADGVFAFDGKTSSVMEGVTWSHNDPSFENNVSGTVEKRYIQIGKGSAAESFTLRTSGISGTITKVVVDCASGSAGHTIAITVGGNSYLAATATPTWSENKGGEKSGTGTSSGEIVITFDKGTSTKAMYIHSIEVQYTKNVANVSGHEATQAKVVEFAQYLNTQMNGTNVCSGTGANLATAWGNVATKYDNLFGAGSSLSSTELAFAKNMLANATANWNESHDSNEQYCLERAMKTYEFCVTNYSGTCSAFMSAVRPLSPLAGVSSPNTGADTMVRGDASTTIIVVIISLAGAAAIGGYFFLRRRKED